MLGTSLKTIPQPTPTPMSPQITKPNRHVAVLAFPFATHAAPLLTVTHRLAVASPTTHFSFFNTSKSNTTILSSTLYDKLPNLNVHDVWDGVPEGYVFVGKHQEDIELFMNAAVGSFREGIQEAEAETGRKVSCLVTDGFFWFGAEMAEEMQGVDWLPFWTGGPNSLSIHVYTDLIRTIIGVGGKLSGREDECINFIPGMNQVRVRDLPEGVVFGNLDSLFSRMLHQTGQVLHKSAAVFVNSFEEFNPSITKDLKSKFKKFLNIGPFILTSPPPSQIDKFHCLPFLDVQSPASVAYISFGTVTTPPEVELVAIAEALESSKVPFIWSLKETLVSKLPNGFLANTKSHGTVVPWAPQLDVLQHKAVGVFVTHCGWNSLLESIAGGVPLICRPFFGDQRLTGRMVEDEWKIGVRVGDGTFTKEGLVKDLELVLCEEKGKQMRREIKKLKEFAQQAVGPQGSSSQNFKELLDFFCLIS